MQSDWTYVGGSVGDGAAVGRGARGGNVSNGASDGQLDDIRRLLDELTRTIPEHRAEVDDPDELTESVSAIREELAAPQPRRGFLSTTLKGVVAGAGGVSAIADVVSKVSALVRTFL